MGLSGGGGLNDFLQKYYILSGIESVKPRSFFLFTLEFFNKR